ncbi:hypothetical protein CP08DC60_1105B, partial [Chlamydia psittaci 08DC60]
LQNIIFLFDKTFFYLVK